MFLEPLRQKFQTVEVISESELDLNSPTLRKAAGNPLAPSEP